MLIKKRTGESPVFSCYNKFMENKVSRFVFWTPRILSIILIAFLVIMSLDVFEIGMNFWQILGGLFMHNIPVLILLVVFAISWKYEIVGGIVFILAGILYIFISVRNVDDWRIALAWSIQIAGTAFVIGGFFIANWMKKIK
jgi:hypothetical protein